MKVKRIVFMMIAAALVLAGLGTAQAQDKKTIAEIVVESSKAATPEFTTLLAAVSAADESVLTALSDPMSTLTVFAPTDAAFAAAKEALGEEAFAALLADKEALTSVLLFHVLGTAVMSKDVVAGLEGTDTLQVPSLQGQTIDITKDGNAILINGAALNLKMVDIEASNGVIHVIDAVILPESRTIAEIVVAAASAETDAQFKTLLAAVQAADPGVLDALSNREASLTVFAPTDAAFEALVAALGEDAFNKILADQAQLSNILLYHVVPNAASSFAVAALLGENKEVEVDTALEGSKAKIMVAEDGSLMINNAKIVMTNIDAANGVIHVIDAVLVPGN